jgi:hypothetical protein
MPERAAIDGLLVRLMFAVPLGTVVGTAFLRAALSLYNEMAGGDSSPSSVPKVAFRKAMVITFVTSLVQAVTSAGVVAAGEGGGGRGGDLLALLISFPGSLLIMAAMLSALLPTTFARAILVSLCYMLVVILVVGAIVDVVAVVTLGLALKSS